MKSLILSVIKRLKIKPNLSIKKYFFNIIWSIIHATILSVIISKTIGAPVISWLTVIIIYISFYWVTTNILIKRIINDEVDGIDD
ncbi:hypothetical protein Q4Q34_06550 [Flavivirga abyssicola]|uniref:hypothetical protein n=1 Tax=Flavivirga abyssicola TaxID=3063533 RepID=UPI0026DF9006|nr:hypothetical protein [Flavivirga sp. MEBiC07777]WVK14687.1 hypothetical protein Q4Q34_06550 [Flavivirga sp. MEBiC07777]